MSHEDSMTIDTSKEAAEAEVARLKDENERLREALTTSRDYVKDVATGALVNVSPVSLVGMAKDDLDMINAALAASRAAPDCHQPDLVIAAQSLRITGPNSDGEYWLHINAGGLTGGINLGSEHGICKHLLDAASSDAALDMTPAPAVDHEHPDDAAADRITALEKQIEELRNLCDCDCDDDDCVRCAHYPAILEQKKGELDRARAALASSTTAPDRTGRGAGAAGCDPVEAD